MRYIVIDKYTGQVTSVCEIPHDKYILQIEKTEQEVIKGFQDFYFDLGTFDYFFNGISFDEVLRVVT